MRHVLSLLLMSAVLFGSVAVSQAAPKEGKKGAHGPSAFMLPKDIVLTPEQQTKIDEVKIELKDKAEAAQVKLDAILTPELKKAVAEATKAARAEGKKGKEIQAAENEALSSLSAEQKESLKAARKEVMTVKAEFISKISPLLTEEQRTKLPKTQEGGKKKKEV